ncbi:MAG: outer membrane protein assembly factor BamA [Betaproteobacteria bacterium RIFCSPLOWO2_02_FULL_67_26]|nr:MAG: outer membrane protein assembly factor BamA [Betaproteobacteria bacterium RIFCSPLOWO2_02_FULL_67_26]
MRWFRAAWLVLALHAGATFAIEPFVIRDIRVEGIQRTEAGTVFSYLPVKVGDTLTDEKAAQAIRALFATGFFRDVSLEREGDVLVVVVQERPSVAQVDFTGMHEFNRDQLIAGMRQIGLAEGQVFDRGVLERAEQELKRQYLGRGYYAVSISTTVTPLERNRVSLNFNVEEGRVAKIRQISIIGGKTFRERELLNQFVLRTPGIMTWFSKHDQYSRQKLSADLESLRSFYFDRGYLEFSIDSTQVSITPDKQDIYITISISEGSKYTVSGIKVAGKMLIPEAEVRKLIRIKPGEVFSRARLTESTKLISERLGNDGYAFANVNAIPELDKAKQQAAFTFFIDPGRRVYVRRVNIAGNSRTRDEVIRREMRQLEGAWYSGERITQSKQRVDRLGYFNEVNVETPAVPGTTDQVDVNVAIVEKPTGVLLFGAGFGSGDGLTFSGSVSQQNIFGSGRHVSLSINSSQINTVYAMSYTNPYFTVDGVSQGFDLYYRELDPSANNLARYNTETLGGQFRMGVPITDLDTIHYGLGYEIVDITTFSDSPLIYRDYVATFGPSNSNLFVSAGWASDGRDSLLYPTKGTVQKAAAEIGLPGGDLNFYKLTYQYQRYFPLTRLYTLLLNSEFGYGDGYQNEPLPFFKNFYAGGVTSVRGFKSYTIGPKDSDGNPRGGSQRLVGNAEFLFPFPGLENDRSVRVSTFMDMGYAGDKFELDQLRFSAGLAVFWASPLGPLKISVAAPLKKQPLDETQVFQFTIGGLF